MAKVKWPKADPTLFGERRNLCIELAMLKERVFRARLYETGHLMDEAVKAIGYEVAEQQTREGRG